MMKPRKTIRRTGSAGILLFALLIAPFPAAPQEIPEGAATTPAHEDEHITLRADPTLSLNDVIKAAADRAPDRLLVEARDAASRAYERKASSLFADSPTLSVSHQNDFLLSDQGLREWEGRLELPIWAPGEKSAYRNQARTAGAEARAYRDRLIWAVARDVRELVWQVRLREATLEESRAALTMADNLLHDVERRIASGDLPRNSLILAKQEQAARRIALKGAERDYVDSAMAYENYTGLDVIPTDIAEARGEVDDAYAIPPVIYARQLVAARRAEYDVARRGWSTSPTLSLGVKRERGGIDDRSVDSVNLGFSIPLGSGTHAAPRRAEAAAGLAEAERQKELAMRTQRLALHEAEHELDVCLVQQEIAQDHYGMARENLRLARKAFDLGESDLMDLLRVREQYIQSSGAWRRQQLECGRATARHNQTKGILPQ